MEIDILEVLLARSLAATTIARVVVAIITEVAFHLGFIT